MSRDETQTEPETAETPRERVDALTADEHREVLLRIAEGLEANDDDPIPYWLASLLNDYSLIDYAGWEQVVREGR